MAKFNTNEKIFWGGAYEAAPGSDFVILPGMGRVITLNPSTNIVATLPDATTISRLGGIYFCIINIHASYLVTVKDTAGATLGGAGLGQNQAMFVSLVRNSTSAGKWQAFIKAGSKGSAPTASVIQYILSGGDPIHQSGFRYTKGTDSWIVGISNIITNHFDGGGVGFPAADKGWNIGSRVLGHYDRLEMFNPLGSGGGNYLASTAQTGGWPNADFGICIIETKFYKVNGHTSSGYCNEAAPTGGTSAAVTWTNKTATPTATFKGNASGGPWVTDKLHALGSAGTPGTQNQQFDQSGNSWTAKTAMPAWRHTFGCQTAYTRKIYVVGGQNALSAPQDDVYEYDFAGNSWATRTAIGLGARSSAAFVEYVNTHAILAGGTTNGAASGRVARNEEFDFTALSWTTKSDAPYGKTFIDTQSCSF